MKPKHANDKTMSESILEWFEKHPDQATRSTPLALALGLNHDRVADGLWRLAKQGKLVKCKVTVGEQDRIKGAPLTQWEYKLPAGAFALSEITPLKPVKAYRREPSSTQAGSGITPAVSASNLIVDHGSHDAAPPPMADTVVEQLPQDESLAVAGSDVPAPEYHPDEVCFDAVKRADALQERAEKAERDIESICSANRKFCAYVSELGGGTKYPLNLYECQNIIGELIDDATDMIEKQAARIASLEGNAALPLEIAPKTPSTAVVKDFLTTQPDHFVETNDMVNHPPHYQGKVECIDAIESALGPDGFAAYCRGNAIKYAFRAGRKGDAKLDLAKAIWYLARVSA